MEVPSEPPDPNSEPDQNLLSVMIAHFREMWRSGGPERTILFLFLLLKRAVFSKLFILSLLYGTGACFLFALGQSYAIGFYPAWKIYRLWWILSPLYGPLFLVVTFVGGSSLALIVDLATRKGNFILALLVIVTAGTLIAIVGYQATREDNPLLSSQPTNLAVLSQSAGEQSRVLGKLSESGTKLLSQLNTTEIELETAKKQLAVTLENFNAQREAAGQVTEELRVIDARQKQIALQTEELERILEGQKPITRHDLQRATLQGWIAGLVLGFLASFFATMAYNAFGRRKSSLG
jgi:hypothetical protein